MRLSEFIDKWNTGINWLEDNQWDNEMMDVYADTMYEDFQKTYGVQPRRPLGISQLYKPVICHLLDTFEIYESRSATLSSKFHLWLGNSIESLVINLMHHYGVDVSSFQKEVEYRGVPGHIDMLYKSTVLDVKSMKYTYFAKWKEGNPDDYKGYVTQLLLYKAATKSKNAALLALNKQTGELGYFPVNEDMLIEVDDGYLEAQYCIDRANKVIDIVNEDDISELEHLLPYIPRVQRQPLGGKKYTIVPKTMEWDSRKYCFWKVGSGNKIEEVYDHDTVLKKLLAYKQGEVV